MLTIAGAEIDNRDADWLRDSLFKERNDAAQSAYHGIKDAISYGQPYEPTHHEAIAILLVLESRPDDLSELRAELGRYDRP